MVLLTSPLIRYYISCSENALKLTHSNVECQHSLGEDPLPASRGGEGRGKGSYTNAACNPDRAIDGDQIHCIDGTHVVDSSWCSAAVIDGDQIQLYAEDFQAMSGSSGDE